MFFDQLVYTATAVLKSLFYGKQNQEALQPESSRLNFLRQSWWEELPFSSSLCIHLILICTYL